MKDSVVTSSTYRDFLAQVKRRVQEARVQAGRAVNRELVLLYWDIGQGIVEKQRRHGWGAAVVENLAADLRQEFPGVTGFSTANLWRMRQFFESCSSPEFLAQVVRDSPHTEAAAASGEILAQPVRDLADGESAPETEQILAQAVRELVASVPWGHHVFLLSKIKDPAARLFYLRETARFGWSRAILLHQVKAGTFERSLQEKKIHNFTQSLPEEMAEQADEMLKSRYSLEFLGLKRKLKERDLEQRLIERVQQFILELGYGFCFIGRQYRLALADKEYFVDLLFYHRFLKTLVAIDLKIRGFEPEHAGKMDFYLNVLNEKERAPDDRPSIGIILCAEKNNVEVEFALKSKTNPIGVAEYRLRDNLPPDYRDKMPTPEQLAEVVRRTMPQTDVTQT